MAGVPRRAIPATTVLWCLLLAGCSSSPGGQPTPTKPAATRPPAAPTGTAARAGGGPICGRLAKPPATWAHVVWIWMENRL
jgi:hypothetical protein